MGNVLTFKSRLKPTAAEIPAVLTDAELREQIEIGMQAALDVADHFIAVLNRMDGCPPLQVNAPEEATEDEPAKPAAPVIQLRETTPEPVAVSTPARQPIEDAAPPVGGSSVIHVEPLRWGGNGNILARAGIAVFDLSTAAGGVLSSLTRGR